MKIKILDNEHWWGGVVDIATGMPYDSDTEISIDIGAVGNDQRSPLFLSDMGRYIESDKPFVVLFSGGFIEIQSEYEVRLKEGFVTLKGAHRAAATARFGKSGQIPDSRFFEVPQYNTWIELMYNQNQKQILEYAHSIIDNGLPAGILMIDEGWAEDYGVFEFYPGRFDAPEKMIDELHSMGFTVMLWITPQISPDSNTFRELRNTDLLIKDKNDNFAIRKWWNGYSCVLDLSNPGACKWFENKLSYLTEKYNIDGYKFDAGDPYFYSEDDNTYKKQLKSDNTKAYDMFSSGYRLNELRAVWDMGGEPIVCRLQDKKHKWDKSGLNCIIPNTIVQGLLGYYYGCPDMIGGGSYGSFLEEGFVFDEELYLRWTEASILCPMMQFSVAPWRMLSEKNYRIVLELVNFRKKYAGYIMKLAENAAKNYEPVIRSLEYEFPHSGYAELNDMFMLGDKYLVAPVLIKGDTSKQILFPAGKWKDAAGKEYHGGEKISFECPLDTLLVFERV